MSNEEKSEGLPDWISHHLPPLAVEILTTAARRARCEVLDSLERRRYIDDAIDEVQRRWPELFRQDGDGDGPCRAKGGRAR
jgi:hypothetical protein